MKIDQADTYFSRYIRTRDNWTCQRCLKRYEEGSQGLHCSHFFGRRNEATRFDEDNCVALCFGCHKYFDEHNREAYRDFKLNQLGEKRFKALKVRANTIKKKDRKMEAIKWREALKSL